MKSDSPKFKLPDMEKIKTKIAREIKNAERQFSDIDKDQILSSKDSLSVQADSVVKQLSGKLLKSLGRKNS